MLPRQGSLSSLATRGRSSESYSFTDSYNSTYSELSQPDSPLSARKPKSSTFNLLPRLKKKLSHSRLAVDSSDRLYGSSPSPPPPMPYLQPWASSTSASFAPYSPASVSLPVSTKRGKVKGKPKSNMPPALPPKDDQEPELTLDTNLEQMEGIIDLTARPGSINDPMSSSPGSGLDSSLPSSSFGHGDSFHPISPSTTTIFSNPFQAPTSAVIQQRPHRQIHHTTDKVSPKTLNPTVAPAPAMPLDSQDSTVSWEAPESWAVEKDGEDPAEPPDYSSSEESATGLGRAISSGSPGPNGIKKNKSHRISSRPKGPPRTAKQSFSNKTFKVRIYRANNTYHVASIGLSVTVADLTPVLNAKLLQESERESHRLYLKERGRGA